MNQTDLEVLSRFEEVWLRVQNGQSSDNPRDTEVLETLLEQLHYLWSGYRKMSRWACGCEKYRLIGLAEQLKKHYSRLQLHYFLISGDIYTPTRTANFASYTPYNLRKLWKSTVEFGEKLQITHLKGDETFVADLQGAKDAVLEQADALKELISILLK